MSFKILNNVTQEVFGGTSNAHELTEKYYPKFEKGKIMQPIDTIINRLYKENSNVQQIRIGFPYSKKPTAYFYSIIGEKIGLKTWKNGKMILINRYTASPIKLPKKIQNHEIIEQNIFDLHCGFWMGITGKIITFLVGIICTSLPVTGFVFWFSKKRKRKTIN